MNVRAVPRLSSATPKILAFDTMGTLLDWRRGMLEVCGRVFARENVDAPEDEFVDEYRRRSLIKIRGLVDPPFSFDEVLAECLTEMVAERDFTLSLVSREEILSGWRSLPV